jgi:hypothetical protein
MDGAPTHRDRLRSMYMLDMSARSTPLLVGLVLATLALALALALTPTPTLASAATPTVPARTPTAFATTASPVRTTSTRTHTHTSSTHTHTHTHTHVTFNQNAFATREYIRADYTLLRASNALAAPAQANALALNQRLGQECPQAGAGSPENKSSEPMSHEVAVALWSITFGIAATPIHTFVETVSPLRWTNPRLTALAQRYATDLSELAALPAPDLCSDVRAWSATGFKTVPADALSLVQHAESIEPQAIPQSLLSRYETARDKRIFARAHRLETKLQNIETSTGFNDWDKVLATLGLNQ